MSRLHFKAITLALMSVFFATGASAGIISWTASLDGAQEVPASGSSATGSAFGTLDDLSGTLSWNISFSGLSGPAVGLHFHGPAPAGANAGVLINVGDISGLTSSSIGSADLSPMQIGYLLDGLMYINVHTAQFPAGEIRGQVEPASIPAPTTLALLGLGLLGLGRKKHFAKS